jgi:predicted kinase
VLIILRGISGSGKSTIANKLKGATGVVHSTDDVIESQTNYDEFFNTMNRTKDFGPLGAMHRQNLNNDMMSMDKGISPVIIDNTNLTPKEFKPYVLYGLSKGYKIQMENIGTGGLSAEALAKRNQHGVTIEKIQSMIDKYNSVGPLSSEQAIKLSK